MKTMDLHHDSKGESALDSQTIATDTDTNGNIIDMQGYHALEVFVQSGALTDGAYVVKLQHGDAANLSDAADVSADEQLGGSPAFADTEDDKVKRLGYAGKKRYVRAVITSTSTTSGGVFSAVAVKANPLHSPEADD